MKATFKTSQDIYVHKLGWIRKQNIPFTKLTVTTHFEPAELAAIERLGLEANLLVNRDNLLYRKTISDGHRRMLDNEDIVPPEFIRRIQDDYSQETEQVLISALIPSKPGLSRETILSYRTLAGAHLAIEAIKEELAKLKRVISAPDPETTIEF